MKNIVVVVLLSFALLTTKPAQALVVCCQTINLSDGHSGCMIDDNGNTNDCPSPYVEGICRWNSGCDPVANAPAEYEIALKKLEAKVKANKEAGIENTDTYYGQRDGGNMSGSGRAIAAKARLDACFNNGYTDTDSITSTSGCYAACDTSSTNVACNGLTGSDSCYSRCGVISW